MSESYSDCYLCGARNDAQEKFCVRCNGQLLRLAPEPEHDIDELVDAAIEDLPDEPEPPKTKATKWRKGSVEDERLSAALGLQSETEIDEDLIDTVVTSIPRAVPATEMPIIGTRTLPPTQAKLHSTDKPPYRIFVLLALLVLATGYLGYITLKPTPPAGPDELAFTAQSTSTTASTTSTTIPQREWTVDEVDGRFASAFVGVELFECRQVTNDAGEIDVEQVATGFGSGVAIDDYNVLLDASNVPGANIGRVLSRSGAPRIAVVNTDPGSGAKIATSIQRSTRNLRLEDTTQGEPSFYLHFDPETAAVQTSTEALEGVDQIVVTNLGDAVSIRVGGRTFDHAELRSIDARVEQTASAGEGICSALSAISPLESSDASAETQTTITNGVEESS